MTNHLFSGLFPKSVDPNKACLRIASDERYSFGDVLRQTEGLAAELRGRGVKSGDCVAAQLNKSAQSFFLYIACIRIAAAFLPLNRAYTDYELEFFITDASPTLFVVEPDRLAAAQQIGAAHKVPQVCAFADLAPKSTTTRAGVDQAAGADSLAAILYTSGTTGRPKGAMLSHQNLRSNAEALARTWDMSPSDILIHALPIYHAHGLFISANTCLVSGAEMIFLPRFDAAEVVSYLPDATVFMGVPTFYTRLLEQAALDHTLTRDMRLFVSGSAPLLAATHVEFEQRTGHQIVERYGLTETQINTSNPYRGPRVPGSVGKALPGIEIRVANAETGVAVPQGETGVVEVRGPNVFLGYRGLPKSLEGGFRDDGFFVTGDLGKLDAAGYLSILGRTKDLVISGGYNIYPKEVEMAIDAISGVVESAVVGVPHPDFGEAVTAAVVVADASTLSQTEILETLRRRLAGYKLPKKIFFEKELPRNAMSKVQKNMLRERYKSAYAEQVLESGEQVRAVKRDT